MCERTDFTVSVHHRPHGACITGHFTNCVPLAIEWRLLEFRFRSGLKRIPALLRYSERGAASDSSAPLANVLVARDDHEERR